LKVSYFAGFFITLAKEKQRTVNRKTIGKPAKLDSYLRASVVLKTRMNTTWPS
jgi:hypothetical protein